MGKKKGSLLGSLLTLGAGVAAGWTLRKFMQNKYDEITDLPKSLRTESVTDQQLVKTLFEEYSTQARDYFNDVQDQLKDNLVELREEWDKIDKRKYRQLVDAALEDAQKEQKVPQKQVNQLRDYLLEDWDELRETLRAQAKETKKAVKK